VAWDATVSGTITLSSLSTAAPTGTVVLAVLIFARADRAQNRITVLNLTAKTTRAQLRLQRR